MTVTIQNSIIERLQMLFQFYKEEFARAEKDSRTQYYAEGRMHQAFDTLRDLRSDGGFACDCRDCKEEMPF